MMHGQKNIKVNGV